MIALKKNLAISRQCSLLGLNLSSYYYINRPMSKKNLYLMKRIDEIFTENPDFGSRQIRNRMLKGRT